MDFNLPFSWLIVLTGALLLVCSMLGYIVYKKAVKLRIITTPLFNANRWNSYLCLLFLVAELFLIVFFSFRYKEDLLPRAASVHAEQVDQMFWITLVLTGFIFLLTQILLFYFAFKYSYSPGRKVKYFVVDNKLEFFWTTIPAITFIVLFFFAQRLWGRIMSKPGGKAVELEIMGEQFNWRVRYPGTDGKLGKYNSWLIDEKNVVGMDFRDKACFDDFMPLQIHLPKGKEVVFKLHSRDVIHSVFIPYFRLKMDALPFMPTEFRFVPKHTTKEMRQLLHNPNFNYEIACAELCGRNHFAMRFIVVVDEWEDYQKWYKAQKPWLAENPEYLARVPEELTEYALKIINHYKEKHVPNEFDKEFSIKNIDKQMIQ